MRTIVNRASDHSSTPIPHADPRQEAANRSNAQSVLNACACPHADRTGIRGFFASMATATIQLVSRVSPVHRVESSDQEPETTRDENGSQEKKGPTLSMFGRLTKMALDMSRAMGHYLMIPIRWATDAIAGAIQFLRPHSSEIVFTRHNGRGTEPNGDATISPSVHAARAMKRSLLDQDADELSHPRDRADEAVAVALARIAHETSQERKEAKQEAQHNEQVDKLRKKLRGQDAVRAKDRENGITSQHAEDIVHQLDDPYGISVESAVARMDELNRYEKN